MNKFSSTAYLLVGLCAAPLACSGGGDVNIGDTQQLGSKLSDYAAHWTGYAEAYTFAPSNSDRIQLVLDGTGSGNLQVGSDALLPAPTNPDLGFPAGDEDTKDATAKYNLQGGVLYPVHAARVDTGRIQFGLKPTDYYAAWCAIQTPHYVLSGYNGSPDGTLTPNFIYSCIPGGGGGSSDDGTGTKCSVQTTAVDGTYTDSPVDCGKFYLCINQVCACTATSCGTSPALDADTAPAGYPAELDGALDATGKSLTGTLTLGDGTRVIVHLQRQ